MIGLKRALLALAGAGLATGLVILVVILEGHDPEGRAVSAAVGLFVGWAFIGTGLYAWWRRPGNRVGALMTGVGFTWFAVGLTFSDVAALFTTGLLFANVYFAIAIHMLLAYPTGKLESTAARRLVIATYVVATVLWLPFLVVFDPRGHDCDTCPDNLLQVTHDHTAFDIANGTLTVAAIAVILGVVAILFGRWRRASRRERGAQAPVLWAGIAMIVLLALTLLTDLASPDSDLPEVISLAALLPFASIPFAFLAGLMKSRVSRAAAVADLITRLSEAQPRRGLRDALADALNDRSLQLVYWLPEREEYVDFEGHPVELPDGGARAVAEVEHAGDRVGAIVHDAALADEPDLVRATGAAAALAIANERLDAQLRARLEELRTSRARLVEAGDAERRRLERNLHDGAQQRLVALALSLRLARGKLPDDPGAAAPLLESAARELELALNDLRELARGIHPAILTDRGLDAAITALADRAPVPVELARLPVHPLPPAVEAAAYFVVSESLANMAKYSEASKATVSVQRTNGRLVIEVADDGVGGADPARGSGIRGLTDRVAALDGRLLLHSPPGAGTLVRAEIPCA